MLHMGPLPLPVTRGEGYCTFNLSPLAGRGRDPLRKQRDGEEQRFLLRCLCYISGMRGRNEKKTQWARALRRETTSAESRLWAELRNRQFKGFKFVRQEPIGLFIADFVCREARLVVEVDGATHSTVEEKRRDRRRTVLLQQVGYRVIRVQNDDVYHAMEGVLRTIAEALQRGR